MSNNIIEQPTDSITQACAWVARLWADDVSVDDHTACNNWRRSSKENEQAWQRVLQLQEQFTTVPDPKAVSELLGQNKNVSRRQFLSIAVVGLGVGALTTKMFTLNTRSPVDYATTKKGEIKNITLADGTKLSMNTSTRVDINIDQYNRQLMLHEGEIYIETAHHSTPFTVVSKEGVLQPLGTRFTVRLKGDQTKLSVFEGRVQIKPSHSDETRIIESGLGADFTQNGVINDYAADISSMAWTENKLAVADMPLTEFIDELSRYRSGRMKANPKLASLTITGVFSLDNTDRILQQLTEILPVKLHTFTPYWVNIDPA